MEADDSLKKLLYNLEKLLLQPDLRKSAPDVADLLADEFIEFGSSGRIFDKQQIIENLQNETLTRRSITKFNTSVLAAGVVLVTYCVVRYNTSGEQPVYSLRSSIWKLVNDQWKIVFHQGTLTRES
ncbi:DUF4440 domain-containing protein [Halotia branconii]|uniref:DUF4440 domain-containing protein n=1 Tax=Halotia branconii CENA392 TaxID=1539056 RepID=A0AAJ6NST2_9CYAN|nr:DUF4440 domain-containing protein [Halotia branconii]WGV25866.1 DUF4440 domain-containing protein [Halotia branconii CENA392]